MLRVDRTVSGCLLIAIGRRKIELRCDEARSLLWALDHLRDFPDLRFVTCDPKTGAGAEGWEDGAVTASVGSP